MPTDPPIDTAPPPPSRWQSNRLIRVLVRTVRTWLQSFLAIALMELTGNMAASIGGITYIPASTASQMLMLSGYVALWPAGISLVQNLIEELSRLDPGTNLRG